jgi:hypothetical protein
MTCLAKFDDPRVRVLERYAPTVPGFFLYYPKIPERSAPLRSFVDAAKELALRTLGPSEA